MKLFRKSIRLAVTPFFPKWLKARDQRVWIGKHAVQTQCYLRTKPSLTELIDYFRSHEVFAANQKRLEITEALRLISNLIPRRVCEIGSQAGGTLALLAAVAAPDARLLSIDLLYPEPRQRANSQFVQPGQSLTAVQADSHQVETREKARCWLNNEQLDVLFIDGDHSYAGVKSDYEMYAPLVRAGGLVLFHDIHPDYKSRFGRPTNNDVGDVPAFWTEVKQRHRETYGFIESDDQDGYGIGVIRI